MNNNNNEIIIIKSLPNYLYKKIIGYVFEFLKYCKTSGSGPNFQQSLISSNLKRLMMVCKSWYTQHVTDALLFLPDYPLVPDEISKLKFPYIQQLITKEYKFIKVTTISLTTDDHITTTTTSTTTTNPNEIYDGSSKNLILKSEILKISKSIVKLTIESDSKTPKSFLQYPFFSFRVPLFQHITNLNITLSNDQHWNEFLTIIKPIQLSNGHMEFIADNITVLSFNYQIKQSTNAPPLDLNEFDEIIKLGGLKNLRKLFIINALGSGVTGFNSLLGKQLTSLAIYACRINDNQSLIDLLSSGHHTCQLEKLEIKDCTDVDTNTIYDVLNNSTNNIKYFNNSSPKGTSPIAMSKFVSFLSNQCNKLEKLNLVKTIKSDTFGIPKTTEQLELEKSTPKSKCSVQQLSFMIPLPILSLPILADRIEFQNLKSLEIYFTQVDDIDVLVDNCGDLLSGLTRLMISSDDRSRPLTNKFYNMISASSTVVELLLNGFNYSGVELIEFLNKFHPTLELLSLDGETDAKYNDLKLVICNEKSKLKSLDLTCEFKKLVPIQTYQLLLDILLVNRYNHLSFSVQYTREKNLPIDKLVAAIKNSDQLLSFYSGLYSFVSTTLSKACIDSGKSNFFSPPTTCQYFSWYN